MNAVFIIIILVFVMGYACIALEHPLKINKAASALLMGVALWTLMVIGGEKAIINQELYLHFLHDNSGGSFIDWIIQNELIMKLGGIAEILFFLLGAMVIVETIDSYGGFKIITDKITTTNRVKFLWIVFALSFTMSPVLDNLTTTIVMVALLRKLVARQRERWIYACVIIFSANSGGAWSPIGDITTIMLWAGGKVSVTSVISKVFLASLVSVVVPLIILSFRLRGNFTHPEPSENPEEVVNQISKRERLIMLCMGVGALLFVPVFKTVTNLPPYLGMIGGVGFLWVLTEISQVRHARRDNSKLNIPTILTRIDVSSILFFLGILLAVEALEICGHLMLLSDTLELIPLADSEKYLVIGYIIGLLSAMVDNVPLVAAAIGMYSFELDHYFWLFVSYCAGAGGNILIIASAAGIAAMGLEKIDFIWYFKKITWLAFVGYTAGALFFVAQNYKGIKNYYEKQEKVEVSYNQIIEKEKEKEVNTLFIFQ